jgi:glycosyltransferase involved in cell wall biosynthesis
MPKLFWIGSPFFSEALRARGWEVIAHNFERPAVYAWDDILELAGGPPDAVVVADKSRPPFVLGQESFPCPTVLYAVDTHIHSWLPAYAQSFDVCLVSLRDHLEFFRNQRLLADRVLWSPPYALSSATPPTTPPPRIWPCLFVGTVDPERTPERVRFLDDLRRLVPGLHVTRGAYPALYPQAEVVLNISERGDLNFRVFEALGCGACLVTPAVQHGLTDLFRNGGELVTYPELDAAAAGRAVLDLLADPEKRTRLAEAGLAAVNAAHRDRNRAEALARTLRDLPEDTVPQRLAEARRIRSVWLRPIYLLHAAALTDDRLRAAYVKAAQRGGLP